jgi:hypothetical protein
VTVARCIVLALSATVIAHSADDQPERVIGVEFADGTTPADKAACGAFLAKYADSIRRGVEHADWRTPIIPISQDPQSGPFGRPDSNGSQLGLPVVAGVKDREGRPARFNPVLRKFYHANGRVLGTLTQRRPTEKDTAAITKAREAAAAAPADSHA